MMKDKSPPLSPATPPDVEEHGLYDKRRLVHRGSEEECERVKRAYDRKLGSVAVSPYQVKPLLAKEKSRLRPFKTSE